MHKLYTIILIVLFIGCASDYDERDESTILNIEYEIEDLWNHNGYTYKSLGIDFIDFIVLWLSDHSFWFQVITNKLKVDGYVYQTFDNNRVLLGLMENGLRNGLWNEYYDNGKKQSEGNYVDGKAEGLCIVYYDSSEKMAETNYTNGELNGLAIMYYKNGQKMTLVSMMNGKRHGDATYWHENGELMQKSAYFEGEADGPYTTYYDNGQIKEKGNFKNGKGDGALNRWYENGQKMADGIVTDGDIKVLQLWNEDGSRKTQEEIEQYENTIKLTKIADFENDLE